MLIAESALHKSGKCLKCWRREKDQRIPMTFMKSETSCSGFIHREGTPSGSSLRYGANADADPLLRSCASAMASGMPLL